MSKYEAIEKILATGHKYADYLADQLDDIGNVESVELKDGKLSVKFFEHPLPEQDDSTPKLVTVTYESGGLVSMTV